MILMPKFTLWASAHGVPPASNVLPSSPGCWFNSYSPFRLLFRLYFPGKLSLIPHGCEILLRYSLKCFCLSHGYCDYFSCLASPGAGTNQDINKYLLKHKKGRNYFPPIILKHSQQAWGSPGGLVKPACWAPPPDILFAVSASVVWGDAPEFALLTRRCCSCWSGTTREDLLLYTLKAVRKVRDGYF